MNYKSIVDRYWWPAQLILITLCTALYLIDIILGDGDGIIAKFNLNPLTIFMVGELILLLVKGLFSFNPWLSNISLSLLFLCLSLISFNFIFKKTPASTSVTIDRMISLKGGTPYTVQDTVYFKNFRPNTHFTYTNFPLDGGKQIDVHINEDGVRGERIVKKKGNEKRILLIGDSFIQALQVGGKDKVGHQLTYLLTDSSQVIQHGFSSWAPLLEFNWLLRKGIQFEPDEVILFVYNNDFFSGYNTADEFYSRYARFDQKGYPTSFVFDDHDQAGKSMWSHFKGSWNKISLVKWLSLSYRQYLAENKMPLEQMKKHMYSSAQQFDDRYANELFNNDPLIAYNWNLTAIFRDTAIWTEATRQRVNLSLSYVDKMNDYLQQKNIDFKVVLIPFASQFKDENRHNKMADYLKGFVFPDTGLSQYIDHFCQEKNIPFLNLYPPFLVYKNQHPDEHLYFSVDGHWNENGHKVAAQIIADWRMEQ